MAERSLKKISCAGKAAFLILVLAAVISVPQTVSANMAAPEQADVGTAVTFEKNDTISVVSEVLDITVEGSKADICAVYKMKNTSDHFVSTQSMFLSPNMENGKVCIMVDGKEVSFSAESYELKYDTEIAVNDWKYIVLSNDKTADINDGRQVDSVLFEMEFEPYEEYAVSVSYLYQLGGYPEYEFNVKEGRIEYYLAPAAMWKDFGGLTINLYLDKEMPVIAESNLKFEKTGRHSYQFVSETLPEKNLEIIIDENWYQNIFSTLKSPYLHMGLKYISPLILIVIVIPVFLCFRKRRKK